MLTRSGRQQQQRQVRRVFRQHAQPSDVMSAVWLGLSHRLKTLMGKMGRMSPLDSSGRRLAGAPNLAEVGLVFHRSLLDAYV